MSTFSCFCSSIILSYFLFLHSFVHLTFYHFFLLISSFSPLSFQFPFFPSFFISYVILSASFFFFYSPVSSMSSFLLFCRFLLLVRFRLSLFLSSFSFISAFLLSLCCAFSFFLPVFSLFLPPLFFPSHCIFIIQSRALFIFP